jgi:hypothetical protein
LRGVRVPHLLRKPLTGDTIFSFLSPTRN